MKGTRDTQAGAGWPRALVTGPCRGHGWLYAADPELWGSGPDEFMRGFCVHWKGRHMLMRAATACTPLSCCAWSRKNLWHDWYAGCHSKMSNWGTAEGLLWLGEPDDELAPSANVPPLVLNVGYPAGKFVVKPGRLAMVRSWDAAADQNVSGMGFIGKGQAQICIFNLPRLLQRLWSSEGCAAVD
jgi:hypothetical protein